MQIQELNAKLNLTKEENVIASSSTAANLMDDLLKFWKCTQGPSCQMMVYLIWIPFENERSGSVRITSIFLWIDRVEVFRNRHN